MKKDWLIWVVVAFAIVFTGWVGWRNHEQDKNLALLQHCAARANDGAVGTQAVCINDETEVLSVRCVKGTAQVTCEMSGHKYGFDI